MTQIRTKWILLLTKLKYSINSSQKQIKFTTRRTFFEVRHGHCSQERGHPGAFTRERLACMQLFCAKMHDYQTPCILSFYTTLIQAIWFAEDFSQYAFLLSPHGLASSSLLHQNFSKGAKKYFSMFFTRLLHRPRPIVARVPGLPIRDCAESCNSSVQMCTMINAIDVTKKVICKRLYLVSGRRTFVLSINCPCASTSPTAHFLANSRFFCLFVQKIGPSFFWSARIAK